MFLLYFVLLNVVFIVLNVLCECVVMKINILSSRFAFALLIECFVCVDIMRVFCLYMYGVKEKYFVLGGVFSVMYSVFFLFN